MSDHIIPVAHDHPSAKNRFILDPRSNKLVKLPSSIVDALTNWINANGRGLGLLKGFLGSILSEPLRSLRARRTSRKPIQGIQTSPAKDLLQTQMNDTSVDNLVRRTLGTRIADALISSMVHGIYATDSRLLSVRSTFPVMWEAVNNRGSLFLGMLLGSKNGIKSPEKVAEEAAWKSLGPLDEQRKTWSVYGIKGGLEALTQKLESESRRLGVDIKVNQIVEKIEPDAGGCKLTLLDQAEPLETSVLISALTPKALSNLVSTTSGLPYLSYNPATTVGLVNLVFPSPADKIHPPGFGYLVPRTADSIFFPSETTTSNPNPDGIIGVVFDSTSMSELDESPLAATDLTKLTVMMGGPHWNSYPSDPVHTNSGPIPIPNPEELPLMAVRHLKKVFPNLPEPLLAEGHVHHDCIPTYLVGHGQRLRELHEKLGQSAWSGKLVLTGSGYGGVGVNDCVGIAEDAVEALAKEWMAEGDVPVTTGLERWKNWE